MTMTEGDVTSLRNPRSVHVATRDSTNHVSTLHKSMLRKGKLRILVILYANEFQLRVSRGINPVVSIHSEKPVGLICRFIEERIDLLSMTHTRTSKSKHTTRWSIRGEKRERKRVGCANGQVYRDLARRLLLRTNYFLIVNISTINDFS